MKKKRMVLWIALGVVGALLLAIGIWLLPMRAGEASREILDYTQMDVMTVVDDGHSLTFCPLYPTETKAIIFYPGAKVDYHAYTPIMYQIAQAGVPVVVMKMPLNLAFFDPNAADDIIDAPYFICQNEISEWYVGGHSLGGAMAAQYAAENPDKITGLILWGSYPGSNLDLTNSSLRVLSIYGSADGLTSLAEIEESRSRVPLTSKFYGISGANHAQFGDYGVQSGDGEALIDPSQQWVLITDLTLSFLYMTVQN